MGAIIEAVRAAMQTQLFGGALLVTMLGTLVAWGRNLPVHAWKAIKRQVIVQVDVLSDDPVFAWVSLLLDEHPDIKKSRLLTASAKGGGGRMRPADPDERIIFTPAPGAHLLWFRRRPILLNRHRKEVTGKGGDYGGFQETFTLSSFGRSAAMLREFLLEAHRVATKESTQVQVFSMRYGEWRRLTTIQPRPLESVFLPAGQLERIVADVQEFLDSRDWYIARGVDWRRGHKYHGPPGTGKTTLAKALAAHFGMPLYLASLADSYMTDERLFNAIQDMQERSILFLDDLDAMTDKTNREASNDGGGVTLAGILSVLGGVASKPGMVVIIATNRPEVLDAALTRKGRIDLDEFIGYAVPEQAERMFRHFYKGAPDGLAERFGMLAAGRPTSDLQDVLIAHKRDPARAIIDLENA